jgi:CRP-like cAMP-binding protein
VATGRLKLRRQDGPHEVIVDVAVPGDLVGDVAFTLGAPYPTDAVSLRASRVLLVPAVALRRALADEPNALAALALELAQRVQHLQELTLALSAGSVARRLAGVLAALAARSGEPFPGGILIPMRLRRADLAALAATSAESVSRQVSAWRAEGLVLPQPAGYLICDLTALRRVAAGAGR